MSGEQLQPGTLLNERYRILRVVGKGGMGTVYQAEHVRLDTILAVKEVRAPQSVDTDSQDLLEQCEHEARFLVRLHHPNLPQVTDAFLEDDRFFLVMEYIEGVTLEAKKQAAGSEGLPVAEVIEWALQIADVLAYLHNQNPAVIFRDLKPANVMLQADGRIRLIDFGIARRFQPGAVKDTNLLGSVGYSPPEQFGRSQTDSRTDIYAFGATLHSLLTGKEPSHSPFRFIPVRTLNPAVPDALSRLIDHCLRLDAGARPQSIHEVAMELLAIRDTLPLASEASALPVGAAARQEGQEAESSSGARIILTNPTLRNSGRTQRSPQYIGSRGLATQQPGSQGLIGSGSGPTSAASVVLGPEALSAELAPREQGIGQASGLARGLWIGALATVAVVGGAIAVVLLGPRQRPAKTFVQPTAQVVPLPVAPPSHSYSPADPQPGTSSAPPAASAPSDTGSAPIAGLNRAVTFDSPVVREVANDAQGRPWLRISVSGTAQGQPGDQEVLAAFFYDAESAQITSQMPQTPYSSKDGKLSVATTVTLASTSQPFTVSLDVPLAAFPPSITGGVQFHCVAFYQDQRIGESKTYINLPLSTFSGGSPENSGAPPSMPNNGAPDSIAPRPKIFGTHRGGAGD